MTFKLKLKGNVVKIPSKPKLLYRTSPTGTRNAKAMFLRSCGNTYEACIGSVNYGSSKSCGCYKSKVLKKLFSTHRHKTTGKISPTYTSWINMRQRCSNSNNPHYSDYGGRGITVCDRWLNSFENFLEDMGERLKGLSIERQDNNKGYNKFNCYWATSIEQGRNKRNNIYMDIEGQNLVLTEAIEIHDIKLSDNKKTNYELLRRKVHKEKAARIGTGKK